MLISALFAERRSARALRVLAGLLVAGPVLAADRHVDPLQRAGEYVFHAAGCYGCHTDIKHKGAPLAGGRALETEFGTFYPPNITPDPQTGIGNWSERDFIRAMREGRNPEGDPLYPAFPYPSYTRLTDADLHALWVYLRAQPPVRHVNRPHELKWFARLRWPVRLWKMLYFSPGVFQPDPKQTASWNRGAYLVEAAAHCGECHTPRSTLGGLKTDMAYAGTRNGPEGSVIPNITPDKKTGIGRWSRGDLTTYLESGLAPDGDLAGDLMAEVIDNGLKYLTKDDLAAIADYLQSQPAIEHTVRKPKVKKRREFD